MSLSPLYIKQLLDSLFCDVQNYQGRGRGYQLSLQLQPITPSENIKIVLLCIERKQMATTVNGTDNLFLNV